MKKSTALTKYISATLGAAFCLALLLFFAHENAAPAQEPSSPAPAQSPMPTIPHLDAWRASPHANIKSEAFTHWDKGGSVPVRCAACHSGAGFRDFVGADGSTPWKVDKPAAIRSVIDCVACHNEKTKALDRVTFPSGKQLGNLGASATCMVCHQGRQSAKSVNRAVKGIGEDSVSPKLKFINVHYRAAAATLFGAQASGAFEYKNKPYHGRFRHTPAFDTCAECHDPHRLLVKAENCKSCHAGAKLRNIRTSRGDYDGDGNAKEGISGEIETLHRALHAAIKAYAVRVSGKAIGYDAHKHPYFFNDTNGNGRIDTAEATRTNAYKGWTPRLVKATYNYQFIAKDPGAYAHNPVYAIQILYDSLESLGARVKLDLSKMKRP